MTTLKTQDRVLDYFLDFAGSTGINPDTFTRDDFEAAVLFAPYHFIHDDDTLFELFSQAMQMVAQP